MYNSNLKNDGNYFMYLRKSRADRDAEMRGEGETLARHEKTLVELAKRMNIVISKIYREIVSGESIESRPEVQKMLLEIEHGSCDGVLVMEVERLARGDTTDQGTIAKVFKYSSTKIITPIKTYDPENESDEEYFEFGLFMSRREYKTINRRLQNGRVRSVMDGKYVGSIAPYGYDKVRLEHDKGFTLAPNKDADTIKLIFDWYTTGLKNNSGELERIGVSKIANRLNALHIKPLKNECFTPSTIRDILINDVYCGMVAWNKKKSVRSIENGSVQITRPRSKEYNLYKGLHEPIISKDIFDLAQWFMKQNPPTSVNRRNVTKNPLSGLVICAKCGRKMIRRPYNSHMKNDSLICMYTDCDNVSSDLYLVENKIIESMRKWVVEFENDFKEEYLESKKKKVDINEKALNSLKLELVELNKQLEKAYDFLEKGLYTDDEFINRRSYLQNKINEIDQTIDTIDKENQENEKIKNQREYMMPKIKNIIDCYYTVKSPLEKNKMLKEVIDHVEYLKEQKTPRNGDKENFSLKIMPKII